MDLVGTSRCDVPARAVAGGTVAPLNAARTAQRAVPTRFMIPTHVRILEVFALREPVCEILSRRDCVCQPRVARSSQPWAGRHSPVGAAESGAPQPQRRSTLPELAAGDVRAPVAKFMVPTRGRSDSGVLRSSAPPRLIHHVRTA